MKTEKISEIAYKRSVLKKITNKTEGIGVGIDASYMKLEDVTGVMSSNFILSWFKGAEDFYIQKSLNEIYAAGGTPKYLQLEINIPDELPEKQLGRMIRNFNECANKQNLQIIQCRTYVSHIEEPMVHVTVLGTANKHFLAENMKPGMEVVMVGTVSIGATAIMTRKYEEKIRAKFNNKFVQDCLEINNFLDVKKITDIVMKHNCEFIHCVGDRGVFSSAWELASAINKGIEIDVEKIPVWQETIEIAELFDYNPYMADGTGAVLIVSQTGQNIVDDLNENGFYANVIGKITEGNDRVVVHGEERRFLEPPRHNQLEEVLEKTK